MEKDKKHSKTNKDSNKTDKGGNKKSKLIIITHYLYI